jgi:hypothetical protein
MRRIAVYRDGNQMGAQIGPDWVKGIAGFGDTVPDALRDLAYSFDKHQYQLRGNSAGIEVGGTVIEIKAAGPGETPSDVILKLAAVIEERGYQEADFPEPDWKSLAREEPVFPAGPQQN